MTISHVSAQGATSYTASATTASLAFPGNVTAGSLIIIASPSYKFSADDSIAADCTKASGTATIGTVSLDSQVNYATTRYCAIWSAIVTGTGSLTMQVDNFPASSNIGLWIDEFTGSWDSSRLEDSDGLASAGGGAPVGNAMTSAGAALFFAVAVKDSGTAFVPEAAWTGVGAYVDRDHAIYQIVGSGTTDAPEWTAPTGATWVIAGAVYKEAAGGSIVPRLMLLGVG